MKSPAPSARAHAVTLLDQVLGQGRPLSEVLTNKALNGLDAPTRARAGRLAIETLRGLERADRLINRHLRKRPPPHIRNILRLGTVELCQGGAAHGVVSDLTGLLTGHRRYGAYKGLVNAVLRKMAAEGGMSWHDLRIPRLPKWLREPLVQAYGGGGVAAMERAHFKGAPLDITVKGQATDWAARLGGVRLPTGSIRLSEGGQVSAMPGYAEGQWWVQDAAAALPAQVLAPRPGETVLDMCAAPGGKTLQLANAGAKVTALDVSEKRMARLRENLGRTGLMATCIIGDALAHQGGPYEAVLLDAPCSATGTIRRHPELPHIRQGATQGPLIDLQAAMIDKALTLLRPGGRLIFCTCALLPDEGEHQIRAALARHEGLSTECTALALPGVDPGWQTQEGGLRLRPDYWPEQGGMDGFYIACLRKA